jgi:hypothetical protein
VATAQDHEQAMPTGWLSDIGAVDAGIRPLVVALRAASLETQWSCGGGRGHTLRSPIVVFCVPASSADVGAALGRFYLEVHIQRMRVGHIMRAFGIEQYWLMLHSPPDSREMCWLLQLVGRGDFLPWPAPYNSPTDMSNRDRTLRQQRTSTSDLRFWSLRVAAEIGHRAHCTFPFPGEAIMPLRPWHDTI